MLVQLPHQTADNWLCNLRDVSRKCDFGLDCCALCEPTRILGQLIAGVADNAVRIKLLEQGDALTLDQALIILRTSETTQLQAASLQQGDPSVNAIKKSAYKTAQSDTTATKQTRFAPTQHRSRGSTSATCRYCGGPRRHNSSQCPAFGKLCNHCGKENHFAAVCESEAKPAVGGIYIRRVTTGDETVSITISASPNSDPVTLRALPDTGSQLDAIPLSTYQSEFAGIVLSPSGAAKTATGSTINCPGTFAAVIDWPSDDGTSRPVSVTVHVLENLQQPVLCTATQRQLGMLHDGYPHARINQLTTLTSPLPTSAQKQADLESIMADFPKVFDGVCRVMDGPPCHFVLHDDAVPVKLRGSRPISEPLKLPFREELTTQVAQGIIRKVQLDEVTPWIHGVVVVPKKQGGVRFCPD